MQMNVYSFNFFVPTMFIKGKLHFQSELWHRSPHGVPGKLGAGAALSGLGQLNYEQGIHRPVIYWKNGAL